MGVVRDQFFDEAVRNGGFYDEGGVWCSILIFPGDDRIYRGRVETLIVKDDEVFLYFLPEDKKRPDFTYRIPGGSFERDLSHIEQAEAECNEETLFAVKNVRFTGVTYTMKRYMPLKRNPRIEWDSHYDEVYIAEYAGTYEGNIPEIHRDPEMASGKFYKIIDVLNKVNDAHRTVLRRYLEEMEV